MKVEYWSFKEGLIGSGEVDEPEESFTDDEGRVFRLVSVDDKLLYAECVPGHERTPCCNGLGVLFQCGGRYQSGQCLECGKGATIDRVTDEETFWSTDVG